MRISPCLLALTVSFMVAPVWAQPHIKVHKAKVAISAPNEAGIVVLRGAAGAVTSSSVVRLKVTNLTTDRETTVALAADGSFEALILARPGDKLRAVARNDEKKRSQGTFTVPAQAVSVVGASDESAEHAVALKGAAGDKASAARPENRAAQALQDEAARATTAAGATVSSNRLSVLIVVTDPATNEVVAVRQLAGRSRSRTPDLAVLGKRIVDRLATALSRELYVGPARAPVRSSIRRSRPDRGVKKDNMSAPAAGEAVDRAVENISPDKAGASRKTPAEPAKDKSAAVGDKALPQKDAG